MSSQTPSHSNPLLTLIQAAKQAIDAWSQDVLFEPTTRFGDEMVQAECQRVQAAEQALNLLREAVSVFEHAQVKTTTLTADDPLSPFVRWVTPLHPVSAGTDPWTKLIGQVDILGASFHVEAWEVIEKNEIQRAKVPDENWYDLITDNMNEGTGETVQINGRDYFMVITPF